MVQLASEWKLIATKAWSFKLMALSCALSAAEASLPLFRESVGGFWFALINMGVVGTAMFARLLAQKDMDGTGP